jgi:hypothetical protein
MLALNRSLLNREYILMNVLKALASIICMCNLRVILLSNNTPRYFTLFTNGIFSPFNLRRELGMCRPQRELSLYRVFGGYH